MTDSDLACLGQITPFSSHTASGHRVYQRNRKQTRTHVPAHKHTHTAINLATAPSLGCFILPTEALKHTAGGKSVPRPIRRLMGGKLCMNSPGLAISARAGTTWWLQHTTVGLVSRKSSTPRPQRNETPNPTDPPREARSASCCLHSAWKLITEVG